jgi:hypothetical protein
MAPHTGCVISALRTRAFRTQTLVSA